MKKLQVEINARFDNEVSGEYFNDTFDAIQWTSYGQHGIFVYNPYKDFDTNGYDESDLKPTPRDNKSNATKLVKALKENGELEYYYDTMKEMLEDNRYDAMSIWDNFFDDIQSDSTQDIIGFFETNSITYDYHFEKFVTRGYSQGDYAEVYVDTKRYKEVYGTDLDDEAFQEEINHLFWDAPIRGEIAISFEYYQNCVTYKVEVATEHITEFLEDEYSTKLDVDNVIARVSAEYPNIPQRELDELRAKLEDIEIEVSYDCSCSTELLVA